MTISFTRYIDITSGVGAANTITGRQFIGRLYTTNELLPPQSIIEFNSAAEVGNYFGLESEEYSRAVFYFGWISKNITSPQKISFVRWVNVATAPKIFGAAKTQDLAFYQATSDCTFGLTIGAQVFTYTVDTTTAASLSDVATLMQAQVNLSAGAQFTGAVITWEATESYFKFVGGLAADVEISVQEGTVGTPIADILGWQAGATFSKGSLTETITETLENSYNASNNYGTFLFIPALTLDQITEAAVWNDGKNITSMYTVPVTLANEATYRAALENYGGVAITVSEEAGEYPEQAPMMIFAATDYSKENSVQNYMYQEFALTASVSDDTTANTLDNDLINYYGVTQEGGNYKAFYQRGKLQGLDTSPSGINVYANEMWLKDSIGVGIINLLLALPQVAANNVGASQVKSVIDDSVQLSLVNGTIEAGKTLTNIQRAFITEITKDDQAYIQVQNLGYWLRVVIEQNEVGPSIEYKAVYTLIYSKDDVINKVVGQHVLI